MDFRNNPRLLFLIFRDTVDEVAPNYILPIIEQGLSDGSIQTEYPRQLSELIILAANIWMNPMIFDSGEEDFYGRLMIFKQLMEGFGLDVIDEEMQSRLRELAGIYQKRK